MERVRSFFVAFVAAMCLALCFASVAYADGESSPAPAVTAGETGSSDEAIPINETITPDDGNSTQVQSEPVEPHGTAAAQPSDSADTAAGDAGGEDASTGNTIPANQDASDAITETPSLLDVAEEADKAIAPTSDESDAAATESNDSMVKGAEGNTPDNERALSVLSYDDNAENNATEEESPAPTNAGDATVSLSATKFTYSGSAQTPTVAVTLGGATLVRDVDYTVSYAQNVNAGTATATITFIGNYTGTKSVTFAIAPVNASKASVKLSTAKYTYNGKARTPGTTIAFQGKTLKKGTDYTCKYANNVKAGKATVAITFKGNYAGTAKKAFTINPKGTSISGLSAGVGTVTVKWKKQAAQTSGYQIRYSDDRDMDWYSTKKAANAKTISKKISGLGEGERVYVQVRTYKTVNGKTYYSGWSAKKSVVTKTQPVVVQPAGDTVYITRTGSKYHHDWCPSIRRSTGLRTMSISEAERSGYSACKNCF